MFTHGMLLMRVIASGAKPAYRRQSQSLIRLLRRSLPTRTPLKRCHFSLRIGPILKLEMTTSVGGVGARLEYQCPIPIILLILVKTILTPL